MKKFSSYSAALWFPVFLAALFVVQNQIFNYWVHLSSNPQLLFFLTENFTLGILLYGPAVLLGHRTRYLYLFVVALLVSLIFIAQYLYFSFFGGFLQASALKYAGQLGAERSTIFVLLTPRIFVFLINVFVVVLVGILSQKGKIREIFFQRKQKAALAISILIVALFGYGLLFATDENGLQKILNPKQTLHDLNSFTFSPNFLIQKVGICNYSFGDVIGTMLRAKPITAEDVLFVQNWFLQKPVEMTDRHFGAASGRNLIIIQVESLEAAVIGESIDGAEITPNLNKLRKEGLYFNNYYTQVGPGNTADAEFVALNSLYPLTNTVAFIDFANNKYDALPGLLKQNGYHTYVLHGDVPTFWNRANIYPALGYEKTISKNDFVSNEKNFETLSDDDFLSQSIEKIRMFPQPFMATLITLSSHSPFIIPKDYQTLAIGPDVALSVMQKKYLESIHYTDNALGKFITGLKENELYDDALIVIYGDHGSYTSISSEIGTSTDQTFADMRASKVPLIIITPRSPAALKKKVETPGSHLDLYPTIAGLLGVALPQSIFGKDLLGTTEPVVTHRDPYSQIITTILTPKLAYKAAASGIFEEGSCLAMPAKTMLPIANCQKLYDEQSANIKASELMVRGDMILPLSFQE